ncbi:ComEA family DNA-binding protein [Pedobacter foliorum]|uniref:ComEA family DNA-binding protein n=1 Tax=Pedobacter foliorum TaxID=2739058 RepID=UPI001564ECCC|nr:helix-hairpin-helix domain-containing protein [Pedobacter foliorum]NRF39846.1 helix-hairpin-helix domain-containing protein [Pedobacter foliorum]
MRKLLNAYFDFSKREFNGLMVLIVLILMISAIPYIYEYVNPEEDNSEIEHLAIKRLSLPIKKTTAFRKANLKHRVKNEVKHSLFLFDPNTINADDWQRLGLSFKQSAAILKYLAKGGRFRKVEDLQKMYTINEKMYAKIYPYVRIESSDEIKPVKKFNNKTAYAVPKEIVIEINEADSATLTQIKGIGASFAKRIIKYKERVGGFYKKEQLLEVFGLDSAKFEEIKGQISVNANGLKMININTAKLEDFKGHPYIRYKQVNAIIEYRKQHGNYSNIADLNKVAIVSQDMIERLAPYLTF